MLKKTIHDVQVQAIKTASNRINMWLETKINAIRLSEKLFNNYDVTKEISRIQKMLKNNAQIAGFAGMFVGYSNNTTITSRPWNKPLWYKTTSQIWYQKTIQQGDITITEPYADEALKTTVVSICLPLSAHKGTNIKGVLCGILPLKYIKSEVSNVCIPYAGNTFLVDQEHKIVVYKNEHLKLDKFSYPFSDTWNIITDDKKYKDSIFSYGYVPYLKWYLVSQLEKKKVYQNITSQFFINLLIYAVSLVLFLILNFFYTYREYKNTKKLTRAQNIIQSFIDNNEQGFLIADENLHITYCNKQFLSLLQVSDLECLNLEVTLTAKSVLFQNVPLYIQDCIDKMINTAIHKKKTYSNMFTMQFEQQKTHLFCTISPALDQEGNYQGVVMVLDDITQKELDKQKQKEQDDILFQQSKMADLGSMIGAISHQWRQPLNATSIMLDNLLQFQAMDCLDHAVFNENLNHSLANIHYLSNTIDTFKNFYNPTHDIQNFNIKQAIDETNFIIEPYFKNTGIKIEIIAQDETFSANTYKNEFQQIIVNLIINAKDALMEKKPAVDKKISITIKAIMEEYYIRIEDNGPGIKPEYVPNLFKPFKTTKGNRGTGNGLYLSQLIAKQKLYGILSVISYQNPTTFLLVMQKDIKALK